MRESGIHLLAVLWALFATSLALALVYDALTLALAAGPPLAIVPTALIVAAPVALMLFCALNIHRAHGMTEVHFGIFVLLAFLVCYQDWRVILAAATAAVHHLTFNYLGQTMRQIVYPVQRVADIMTAISGASQEQRDGIEQVRASIREIEETTRQTAELVERSADAAGTMCAHASPVAQAVGTLRQPEATAPW